jgi:hypothetical protein
MPGDSVPSWFWGIAVFYPVTLFFVIMAAHLWNGEHD